MKRDEKEEQTEHEGSFYAHVRRTRGKSTRPSPNRRSFMDNLFSSYEAGVTPLNPIRSSSSPSFIPFKSVLS